MSSESIGVTKVELRRWISSWVILSPSCSASRISRASPSDAGHPSSISSSIRADRSEFCPDRLKRSKKTLSLGIREGSAIRPEATNRAITPAMRSAACPSHKSGRCGDASAPSSSARMLRDPPGVEPQERVRARADGDRSLRVVAQREAGHPEPRRLLLDPARVREHRAGVGLEREEVEVAGRLGEGDALRTSRARAPRGAPGCADERGTARASSLATAASAVHRICQERAVDERGAVKRDQQVAAAARARASAAASRERIRSSSATRVSIIVLPTKWARSARRALGREVRRSPRPSGGRGSARGGRRRSG